jgi:catechol 2,3-dioxygenase-like lactoylglutathione lyase family enzyme
MNLNQVTISSTDVPRAAEFYRTLGLTLIVDSAPRYVRFACPDGGATFSIHRADAAPGPNGPVIYFECDDLDADVARLQAAGVAFDAGPVDQTWLWREARLCDPDGNQIILYHAGENRLNPPWRVKEQ